MLNRETWYAGENDSIYNYFGAHRADQGWVFRVWAPKATKVELVGDFNAWQRTAMDGHDGIWETTVPDAKTLDNYKYIVTGCDGEERWKADPFAFHTGTRPETNSKLFDLSGFGWSDGKWFKEKGKNHPVDGVLNIYEVHLGSWKRKDGGVTYSYRETAEELAAYVKEMGYNFVELLPVTEYPLDDSWGYQCTGYFAPTSRYGTPHDFMYLVDTLHRNGIGVILDWVPAHFCKDAHGLMTFDGSCQYEYSDPLKWEHAGWGTRVFDFTKGEVRSFLKSSAAYWLREYHIDGLRVDAVASMLYLDYGREGGQWRPNQHGGRENLEVVSFLQELNKLAFQIDPAVLMAAEESTSWPKVTWPPEDGGLGFNLKWNMGWMNDICHYLKMDPVFRQYHHKDITFAMMYAFTESFVLPISHDEVVHMKGSLRGKMPGDDWQQLAGVRSFLTYQMCHPGKVLTFMGADLGQWHEWDCKGQLDWFLLDNEDTKRTHECIKALNHLYLKEKALWENDRDWNGFQWLVADDNANNIIAFTRRDNKGHERVVVVNFSPVAHEDYRIGVPEASSYSEIFNTDDTRWGGSGVTNTKLKVAAIPAHEKAQSISLRVPPLGAVILKKNSNRNKK